MLALVRILFFIMGIIQFFALLDGLETWIGLHWLIAAPLALIVAYIPVVGTLIGMCGAVYAWQWSWLSAFLLFFGQMIFVFSLALCASLLDNKGS